MAGIAVKDTSNNGREVLASMPGLVKSNAVLPRVATAATFLSNCATVAVSAEPPRLAPPFVTRFGVIRRV